MVFTNIILLEWEIATEITILSLNGSCLIKVAGIFTRICSYKLLFPLKNDFPKNLPDGGVFALSSIVL